MSFYKNKTILITGGTGFIGTHFINPLYSLGAKIIVPIHKRKPQIKKKNIIYKKCDLSNLSDCLKITKGVDYIFHSAGTVSAASLSIGNPMSAISTNLILNLRILEASMINNVKRILLFSSGTTGYPLSSKSMKEKDMFKDDPADIYFGYGWSRRYTELLGKFAASKSNLKVAICRPSAVYGKYDDFNPKTSHVVPGLIERAYKWKNPFIVWGTGNEIRDFLNAEDLINGCIKLLQYKADCDPINIASGKSTTIKKIVKIIFNKLNLPLNSIVYDKSKPTTIPIRRINISKAKKILNFKPKISIEKGVTNTINWYKDNKS